MDIAELVPLKLESVLKKAEKKMIRTLIFLACIGLFLQGISSQGCQGNGFKGGCECNIMGACTLSGIPKRVLSRTLPGYSPAGLEQLAYSMYGRQSPNLAYLCEGKTVAILYDCNARIPLYAATAMKGDQLSVGYERPRLDFLPSGSSELSEKFQQNKLDYKDSKSRNLCYESRKRLRNAGRYFVDVEWFTSKKDKLLPFHKPCLSPYILKTPVHRGHLIAASYGRGDFDRIKATFTYTNAVPQFGGSNSGKWRASEAKLLAWGHRNCIAFNGQATKNVRMYIVVGAIPSTYGNLNPRFYGESGFSDYQSRSTLTDTYGGNTGKKEYRVNVPRYMWTAVCCTFQYRSRKGTRSTAFYAVNEPGTKRYDPPGNMDTLFAFLRRPPTGIDLFPGAHSDCYNRQNFVKADA